MSLSALLGFLFGMTMVIAAVFMNTSDILIFFHIEALMIVFGGTLAVAFMSFQYRYVIIALKAIIWMFKKPKSTREGLNEEIGRLLKWAYLVQQKGLPALESEIKGVKSDDPILRYCLELVATAHKPAELRAMMDTAVESEFERKMTSVTVLKSMAANAPSFGLIGTLVGLIAMLQGMGGGGDNMFQQVGMGMATALTATLYGIFSARMLYLPASSQLQSKEEIERFRNHMVLEGLIMLAEKKSPRFMQDRLNSFLDPGNHFNIDTQMR
jgi:chemotaxis protein MotA